MAPPIDVRQQVALGDLLFVHVVSIAT